MPLVLVFHGGGGRPEGIMRVTGFNDIADRQHFAVAYPAGSARAFGRGGTWNIGGASSPSDADDVGFIRVLLRQLGGSVPIDPRRVYATGESMGGVFAYRLACEMSDSIAAIAAVAATMVEPECTPRSPVAVLHVHGTSDENIPLSGGQGAMTARVRSWPPPARGLQLWSEIDGCSGSPATQADGPETTCQSGRSCRAPVELCLVRGGGHAWPGSEPQPWQRRYGVYVSQSFPASQRIWAFFAANPKVP